MPIYSWNKKMIHDLYQENYVNLLKHITENTKQGKQPWPVWLSGWSIVDWRTVGPIPDGEVYQDCGFDPR